jgi:biopolymer transport protein ExbB
MLMRTCPRLACWMLLSLIVWTGWSAGVSAPAYGFQEPAAGQAGAEPAAADAAAGPRQETFLGWMLRASGIFGFLILLVSFVMVALIVMQTMQLRRDNYLPAAFVEEFERLLNEKNYQAAYESAKGNDSFMGKVLAAGMARFSRRNDYDDLVQGMQEVGEEETMAMEHSIGYLALVGTIAPMLGLLGTVQGMVASFQVIAKSPTQPKPYELADGIATALFTTLEGLVVAIPAIICFTVFKNRLARFILECGFVSEELMKRFQGAKAGSTASAARTTSPA